MARTVSTEPSRSAVQHEQTAPAVSTQASSSITALSEVHSSIAAFKHTKPSHGHVAFINRTLAYMNEAGIAPTLHTYTALLSVFPEKNTYAI